MIKIYQTVVNNFQGNCMQAAVASLLELPIEKIPNFITFSDPYLRMIKFLRKYKYEFCIFNPFDGRRKNKDVDYVLDMDLTKVIATTDPRYQLK